MNIQPLNYNLTHNSRYKSDYESSRDKIEKKSAGLCEQNNRGYNVAFSGGQEQSVAAANTLMGKILKSGGFNWLAKFSGEHNIASSALVALFLAGLLRPAVTVALPGKKDKDDKIYSAGHSMSSALVGFIFSTIITSPLDSGSKFMLKDGMKMSKADFAKLTDDEIKSLLMRKLNDEEKVNKIISENKAEEVLARRFDKGISIITSKTDKINDLKRQLKAATDSTLRKQLGDNIRDLDSHIKAIDTTMKNVVDWGIAIPRAMLTIALIPYILKYVFHLEKKKKPEVQPQQTPAVALNDAAQNVKVSMKDFMGGLK